MAPNDQQETVQSPWTRREKNTSDRPRRTAGVVISICYLGLAAAYAVWRSYDLQYLSPNELGDFLAGVFAPLAFLWLVLGFFQQGDELRQSSEALWLQGQELQNSVEQQRDLVNVTREQLAFEREKITAEAAELRRRAQPDLVIIHNGLLVSTGETINTMVLLNRGSACTEVRLQIPNATLYKWPLMRTGDQHQFNVTTRDDLAPGTFDYVVSYIDSLGAPGSSSLRVETKKSGHRTVLHIP